jgi:ketosteroid isomerase-like protein
MKMFFFLLTLRLSFSIACSQVPPQPSSFDMGSTTSSNSPDTLSEHFSVLAKTWMHAYNNNDSATLSSMYSSDAKYISSHVAGLVAHGRGRIIANFQRGVKLGGHIDSVSILSIQRSCDLATILCKYEATNNGEKVSGRNLLVIKWTNNKWVIVLHMTVV